MDSEPNLNPYASPAVVEPAVAPVVEPAAPDFRRQKRRVLIWMVVLFGVSGVVSAYLSEDAPGERLVQLATSLIFAGLILTWCDYDRRERDVARWPYFAVLMIICPGPLVMVPIYLLATRGLHGLVSTAKAFAFLLLLVAVTAAAAMSTLLCLGVPLFN